MQLGSWSILDPSECNVVVILYCFSFFPSDFPFGSDKKMNSIRQRESYHVLFLKTVLLGLAGHGNVFVLASDKNVISFILNTMPDSSSIMKHQL